MRISKLREEEIDIQWGEWLHEDYVQAFWDEARRLDRGDPWTAIWASTQLALFGDKE